MNGRIYPRPLRISVVASLLSVSLLVSAQEWSIDWWTVDGGGEIAVEGGGWTLSGTLGQWDASAQPSHSGGPWELTGGFWAVAAGAGSEEIFRDGFEDLP